jgi:hypothetical protein
MIRWLSAPAFDRSGAERLLNGFANIAVLGIAILAGVTFYTKTAGPGPDPSRATYQPGDRIDTKRIKLNGPGLVLVTRSTCPACSASLPFYQKLTPATIAPVAAEPVELNRQYLASAGITSALPVSLEASGLTVPAVPTLIAVNSQGQVIRAWRGKLTEKQEQEVIATIQGGLR